MDDIQLIWDNCKTYNMVGSEIYKQAEFMEKCAKGEWKELKKKKGRASMSRRRMQLWRLVRQRSHSKIRSSSQSRCES